MNPGSNWNIYVGCFNFEKSLTKLSPNFKKEHNQTEASLLLYDLILAFLYLLFIFLFTHVNLRNESIANS